MMMLLWRWWRRRLWWRRSGVRRRRPRRQQLGKVPTRSDGRRGGAVKEAVSLEVPTDECFFCGRRSPTTAPAHAGRGRGPRSPLYALVGGGRWLWMRLGREPMTREMDSEDVVSRLQPRAGENDMCTFRCARRRRRYKKVNGGKTCTKVPSYSSTVQYCTSTCTVELQYCSR